MTYWLDGKLVSRARLSAFSHAMNYSCGVFDTVRLHRTIQGPAFFRMDDHVSRLLAAVRFAGFDLPYSAAQIQKAVAALARKNRFSSGYFRLNVFLPMPEMRVYPQSQKASLAISARKLDYAGRSFENGVSCLLSKTPKAPETALPSRIKFSANYLPAYLALRDARARGFDEAILLDSRRYVAEATAQNLFLAKKGILFTPSQKSEIISGITRDTVLALAKNVGIKTRQAEVTVRQLLSSDEVFLTGTATQIMPVTKINRKRLAVGPLTRRLLGLYSDAVFGTHPFSKKWLTLL